MAVLIEQLIIMGGALLFIINLLFIGRRKMDAGSGTAWTLFAILATAMGCMFDFTWVISLIRPMNVLLLVLLAMLLILSAYAISLRISTLRKRNDELAIHVALQDEQDRELSRALAQKGRDAQ